MAEFCIHEKHGGICGKTGTYCNLGACPDEDLKEYAPVKRGRWIYNIESGECVCSACGENALSFRKDTLYGVDLYETCLTDYCPNCGADMRGSNDE